MKRLLATLSIVTASLASGVSGVLAATPQASGLEAARRPLSAAPLCFPVVRGDILGDRAARRAPVRFCLLGKRPYLKVRL